MERIIGLLAMITTSISTGNLYPEEPVHLGGVVVEEVFNSTSRSGSGMGTGIASWYDYSLEIKGVKLPRSKDHNTCAIRKYDRYNHYRVCNVDTGKCVTCYHNDYGPVAKDRIVDLSSHAFREIGSLKRGLVHVTIQPVE